MHSRMEAGAARNQSTVIFMLTLTHGFGTDIQWQNVDPSLMNEALLGINGV